MLFFVLLIGMFVAFAPPTYGQTSKKAVGIGLGISNAIPTIELDLRAPKIPIGVTYKHYFTAGLEIYLKIYAIEKKYIRWHVLDPGIYFLMGTSPFTVRDIVDERGTDITFGTGIEVMPWKNLVISLSLRWFLPGFKSVYAAGERVALEYAVKHFEFDLSKPLDEIIYENGAAAFEVASQKSKNIYKQAIMEPQVHLTFIWYFL